MAVAEPHYVVGIDLGTTNSAVSFAPVTAEDPTTTDNRRIKRFPIPQLTGSGEFSQFSMLPSFLYLPGDYEISDEAIKHPWRMPSKNFAGKFARDFGAKIPNRLATSAKSWLCEKTADRQAPILPWGAPAEVRKVSPVEASAAYLSHIRQSWNRAQGDDEDRYLENQLVVITVPASFDEVARELTLQAAGLAGLNDVTLLEEPLAAFYCWLTNHEADWADLVSPDEQILVCDVGGGTTDFTLIRLRDHDGSPRFERVAVGDHLILGGDNIDLALARHIEKKLKNPLSPDKFKTLCHQCRQAKETILNGDSDAERITLMGEGSSLIAGTITATLTREDVDKIINTAFFPVTITEQMRAESDRGDRTISEFGLSCEAVTAVTAHMINFLGHHQSDIQAASPTNSCPAHILFNGGALKPDLIQRRIIEALQTTYKVQQPETPRVLDNPSHDAAVSIGAAYYGLVKAGQGVRVGSGSPRSYYLAVSEKDTGSDPSSASTRAVCLIERGVEEGTTTHLRDHEMEVMTNQQVRFHLFSSSFRSGDRHGDMIDIDDSVTPLPPLETVIQFGDKGSRKQIPVEIEAQYTEIGSLVLWCRSTVSNHRWQLQFQLRAVSAELALPETGVALEAAVVEQALETIRNTFLPSGNGQTGPAIKKQLAGLVQEISRQVDLAKEKWPVSLLRAMADELLSNKDYRKLSADHEARWLNLMGFAMRPGIGDGFDAQRIKKLWKIYNQGLCFPNQPQVRIEWWIFIRRLACGLKPGQQKQLLQDVSSMIISSKNKKSKQSPQEIIEIWMATANMERLLVKDKTACGREILKTLSAKTTPQYLWALSRLGAREMLYGSADRVIPPDEATRWIETVLAIKWRQPKPAAAAVIQLGRKTGDRTRDIEPAITDRITNWLKDQGLPKKYAAPLHEVVALEKQETAEIFGEALPLGLVLKSG